MSSSALQSGGCHGLVPQAVEGSEANHGLDCQAVAPGASLGGAF